MEFDNVISQFAQNNNMTNDKIHDVEKILKRFKREEVVISETGSFGLPVPVLVHKRNFNRLLGNFVNKSFRRSCKKLLLNFEKV